MDEHRDHEPNPNRAEQLPVGGQAAGGRQSPIAPEVERIVDFHGEPIIAFLVRLADRPQVFVPVRPLCDYLGLSYRRERNRILADDALALVACTIQATAANQRGRQDLLALPLEFLPGWLFSTTTVKAEFRGKLLRYKLECHQVLWDAFFGGGARSLASARQEPGTELAPRGTGDLARIDQVVALLQQVAEGQLAQIERQNQLESTLHEYKESSDSRLDRAAMVVKEMVRRLGAVERRLDPANRITEDQAAVIKAKVSAVSLALSERDPSKNHFQAVYKTLYDQYDISAYSHMRLEQYEQALTLLDSWLERLTQEQRTDSPSADDAR